MNFCHLIQGLEVTISYCKYMKFYCTIVSSLAACDAISQTISFVLAVVFSTLSLPFYCDLCLVPLHFVNVFMYIEKYERIFFTAEWLLHICDHNICWIYIESTLKHNCSLVKCPIDERFYTLN